MTRLVIVPDALSKMIHDAITRELNGRPCDDATREQLYGQLLLYYDEHGLIPDFTLHAAEAEPEEDER